MAGIGFKIQKLLSEETYWGVIKGYVYSAVISSGPWLISILCIGALGALSQPVIGHEDHSVFRAWVMYCYAASLVVSGSIQMLATRYLSDCVHTGDNDKLFASFITVSSGIFAIQFSTGLAYLFWSEFPFIQAFAGAILYAIITLIWIAMIYLSAARDFITIVVAYAVGAVASFGLAYWMSLHYGLTGILYGYTLGQLILFSILVGRILQEFPIHLWYDGACLRFMWSSPVLAMTGFSYNSAIWIDKILFWIYEGEELRKGFYTCHFYETPTYLAYVTIVPTLSIFLIRIETSFYHSYRKYYMQIQHKFSMSDILKSKRDMMNSLVLSFYRLLVYQGIITALCIAYSNNFIVWLKMDTNQLAVLRICILGAFAHAMLMVLFIIVLYFDWKGLAMQLGVLFLLTNGFFTWVTLHMDFSAYGYGYFFSSLLTLSYGCIRFFERFNNLEYFTFMSQPLGNLKWDSQP